MKINKKLNKLTDKEYKYLLKELGECQIAVFDAQEMTKRIMKANELRVKAHKMMLEADTLLDTIQKELLYGKD